MCELITCQVCCNLTKIDFTNYSTNSSWVNKAFFPSASLFNCSLAPTNIYQNYSISLDRKLLGSTHCYGSLQSNPELLTTLNTATTILLYLAQKYPCGKRKAVILTVTSYYTGYYFTCIRMHTLINS